MFSFGLSSVICKIFVADFEHVVFFLLEKTQHKNCCASIPKILCPANKYLLKVSSRNPKSQQQRLRFFINSLQHVQDLVQLFSGIYYEHVFVYCDVFAVTISFSMYLLSILNRFHTLFTFICYQFSIESRRRHQRCSLKKVYTKITHYFQENTCVRVFF